MARTGDEVREWIDAADAELKAQLSSEWLAKVRNVQGADPWLLGFTMIHRPTGAVIGTCGFKGAPDASGMVEIAYGIDEAYRGKGYATEAANALVEFAFASDKVTLVRAHTLENANASARVLTKCGFATTGTVVDPEDGVVWRWERRRSG